MLKKYLIILLAALPLTGQCYEHGQSTEAVNWSDLQKVSLVREVTVPLTVIHQGDSRETRYDIKVNGEIVTAKPFTLTNTESIDINIPITLEDTDKVQPLRICSVSYQENATRALSVCHIVEMQYIK